MAPELSSQVLQATQPPDVDGQHSAADAPFLLTLTISDAEVAAALSEYDDIRQRNEYALLALKVGVIALRSVRGISEGDSVRREGERLLQQLAQHLGTHRSSLEERLSSTLSHYFDPASGRFTDRVDRLVKSDGELAGVMKAQVEQAQRLLAETLDQFVGKNSHLLSLLSPDESNQFIGALRDAVAGLLKTEEATILQQFSLDEPNSALSRLLREIQQKHGDLTRALGDQVAGVVGEFSLDREDSALSRLVGRVDRAHQSIGEQLSLDNRDSALSRLRAEMNDHLQQQARESAAFQRDVIAMLERLETRKQEMMRSTRHGGAFEAAVGDMLRSLADPEGDRVEVVGNEAGLVPRSKVGDFVAVLSLDSAAAGARIVVEAKESQSYTLRSTLSESDEARRNRGAGVGLFVHSAKTCPEDIKPLMRWGNDIVIVWDADDPGTDVVFRAGWLVAKALSVRQGRRNSEEAADFKTIDRAIENLRKQLEGLDEIRTSSETVRSAGEKISNRARIMANQTEAELELIKSGVDRLRTSHGDDGAAE